MPVKAQVFETSASTNSAIRALPPIISGTAKIVQNEYSAVMDFLFFVRIPVWAISADLEGGQNWPGMGAFSGFSLLLSCFKSDICEYGSDPC